ncbi:DNA glycosylase [Epithele typhae]|uniref:DNA glycosylase n=1 Tax=Epithele typhae TaxID=378194 RepID=UPI00200879C3|nr:DNA glycosylase [Epithele typhae]KAH9931148.1 DNA glycosylase [Epithele typhae]
MATRVTRSSARIAAAAMEVDENVTVVTKSTRTRKRTAPPKQRGPRRSLVESIAQAATEAGDANTAAQPVVHPRPPAIPVTALPTEDGEAALVPAILTFSFDEARKHLIDADPRFEEVFRKCTCKPYEELERVDPFRTLAHSILGQQISWKAARAITHRFVRLFDPHYLRTCRSASEYHFIGLFPFCHQVITKDAATLKTAGLSVRKAEYVLDLAARFADGRLTTQKLLDADDEELHRMLTEVRGIGTVMNMFAIFSLRRPDILPVGDLGVQRGALRWFISLHSPSVPISIREDKLADPTIDGALTGRVSGDGQEAETSTAGASGIVPAPVRPSEKTAGTESNAAGGTGLSLPDAFTPSINKTLNMFGDPSLDGTLVNVPALPSGLTVAQMKTRLNGKAKIKRASDTTEMEALTESWRPYRSLAVYYMWALSEEAGTAK